MNNRRHSQPIIERLNRVRDSRTLADSNLKSAPFSAYGGFGGGGGFGPSFGWNDYPTGKLPGTSYDYKTVAGPLWENPSAAACLLALLDAFAQAPPILEEKNGDEWEKIDHPIIDLMNRPNDFYSGKQLWGVTLISEKSQGCGFWRVVWNKAGTEPVELWFEPPWGLDIGAYTGIIPTWDAENFIKEYLYFVDGKPYPLQPHEVVYHRAALNIRNTRRPWNPLGIGAREVATLNSASNFTGAIMRKPVGSVMISTKEKSSVTPDQLKQFKAKFEQELSGDGAGGVAVSNLPLDVAKLGYTPEEMALDKIQSWPQHIVCALLRTPPMVALLPAGEDHKTYENLDAAMRWWWDNTIIPLEDAHGDEIETQLFPAFGLDPAKYRIGWDRSRVAALKDDEDKLWERIGGAYRNQLIDKDEARIKLSFESDNRFKDVFYQAPIPSAPEADNATSSSNGGGSLPPEQPITNLNGGQLNGYQNGRQAQTQTAAQVRAQKGLAGQVDGFLEHRAPGLRETRARSLKKHSTADDDEGGIDRLVGSIDSPQPVIDHTNGKELATLSASTIRAFWSAEADAERQPAGVTHEPVAPFTYHAPTMQYVGRGRVAASAESVKAAAEALAGRAQADMLLKANQVLNGTATASELSAVMEQAIVHLHGANAALAVGGVEQLQNSPAVLDWVRERVKAELAYKADRISAIEAGKYGTDAPLSPQLLQHVGLYGLAGRGTYEGARMVNAKDTLDHDMAVNVLAAADHCGECPELTDQSPMAIDDMPVPGDRICGRNCLCAVTTFKSGSDEGS